MGTLLAAALSLSCTHEPPGAHAPDEQPLRQVACVAQAAAWQLAPPVDEAQPNWHEALAVQASSSASQAFTVPPLALQRVWLGVQITSRHVPVSQTLPLAQLPETQAAPNESQ